MFTANSSQVPQFPTTVTVSFWLRKVFLTHASGGRIITNGSPVVTSVGPHKGKVGKVVCTGQADPYNAKQYTGTTAAMKVGFVLPLQDATCGAYQITPGVWAYLVLKDGIKQWTGKTYASYNDLKQDT